ASDSTRFFSLRGRRRMPPVELSAPAEASSASTPASSPSRRSRLRSSLRTFFWRRCPPACRAAGAMSVTARGFGLVVVFLVFVVFFAMWCFFRLLKCGDGRRRGAGVRVTKPSLNGHTVVQEYHKFERMRNFITIYHAKIDPPMYVSRDPRRHNQTT